MHILILGVGGQLGSDCRQLFEKHHRVTGRDAPELDIRSSENIARTLDETAPDAVVNCTAYTAVDRAEAESGLCHAVNATGPGLLGAACAARDLPVVHISTDYVFDGEKSPPDHYLESDLPNPLSVYGQTKLAGEKALLASGARAAILRTAWLYGIGGPNFLKTMLRLTLANPAKTLRVVNDQWGSPTEASRLAAQIMRVIEADVFPTGVFHATGEGHTTWYEFAVAFLQAMDVPHRIEPCTTAEYPTAAHRPHCAILENAALKAAGLNIMRDWRIDLREFVEQHRADLLAQNRTV